MIAILLTLWLQLPDPEALLTKSCPDHPQHAATADEKAIIAAVAEHYRKFESSVAERHRAKVVVTEDYARHSVPSKKSPQVFVLFSLPVPFVTENALRLELQRHGVTRALGDRLARQLKTRNARLVEWSKPDGFVTLTCRDVHGMTLMRPLPPGLDLTNASAALLFALPAFDQTKQYAAVLTLNDFEALLKGRWGDVELSFLKRDAAGAWRLEWDSTVSLTSEDAAADAFRPSDRAIFEAVLARLGPNVRVVNQTRGSRTYATDLARSAPAAIADMERRGKVSIYLGGWTPRAELVQRETLSPLTESVLGSSSAVAWFALPGYDRDTAVVVYTLIRRTEDGHERGEMLALLERTGGVWRVKSEDFQLWLRSPR